MISMMLSASLWTVPTINAVTAMVTSFAFNGTPINTYEDFAARCAATLLCKAVETVEPDFGLI